MAKIIQKFIHQNNEYEVANTNSSGSSSANDINYDNTTSGLTATNVQAAIDEVANNQGTSYSAGDGISISNDEISVDASTADYDNTTSGLTATNIQDAIDELSRTPGTSYTAGDGISISNDEISVNASTADYDNTTSGITATNIQSAIDEIDSNVDDVVSDVSTIQGDITTIQGDITDIKNIIEATTMPTASATNEGDIVQYKGATTSSYTQGYFYKSVSDGQDPATYSWEQIDVQPNGSVNASNVAYDNTTSGLTSTNVQDALDEVNDKTCINAGKDIVIRYPGEFDYSAMRGPCDDGFHVPTKEEWEAIISLGLTSSEYNYLYLPKAGRILDPLNKTSQRNYDCYYWTNKTEETISNNAYCLVSDPFYIDDTQKGFALSIRAFKDEPIAPDNTWTETVTDKIWHNPTLGLISILVGTDTYITIQDKNVGATSVYNDGDTLTESNCGKYFQWGNNYGFSFDGDIIFTEQKINAGSYLPSTYYNDTFVDCSTHGDKDWSSVHNPDLRGGVTGKISISCKTVSSNNEASNITYNDNESPFEAKNVQYALTKLLNIKTLGNNIEIHYPGEKNRSAQRGPCDMGFHIPTKEEFDNLKDMTSSIRGITLETLHIPLAEELAYDGTYSSDGYSTKFRCAKGFVSNYAYGYSVSNYSNYMGRGTTSVSYGRQIRAFKDEPAMPDTNTWEHTIVSSSSSGYDVDVYHNSTLGLITIIQNDNVITIQDKNVGAKTVWNTGDAVSFDNVGYIFQRGNNYGFEYKGTFSTSTNQIDASIYGPCEFYYDKFISLNDIYSTFNSDLWYDVSSGLVGSYESYHDITIEVK